MKLQEPSTHTAKADSSHLLLQGGAGWQLLLTGKARGDMLTMGTAVCVVRVGEKRELTAETQSGQ